MPAKRETYLRWLKRRVSQTNSRCKRQGVEGRLDADAVLQNSGVVLEAPEGPVYFECVWCREAIKDPRRLSLDHLLPLVAGGSNAAINVRISCRACNLLRSDWEASAWRSFVTVLQKAGLWLDFKKRFKPRRFRRR